MNNFYILLICALLLSLSSCGKQSKAKESSQPQTDITQTDNVNESTLLFEKLMDSFSSNWRDEEPASDAYPEYFGGVFIDNDNILVVAVVGDEAKHRKELATILESDNFKTELCTYSYSEMMEIMNEIDEFLSNPSIPEGHPVIQNFGGAMADVFENRVVVNLLEVNDEVISAFKKDVSDSDAVSFVEGTLMDIN